MLTIRKLKMAKVDAFVADANDERVAAVDVGVAVYDVDEVGDENVADDAVDDVLELGDAAVDNVGVVDEAVVDDVEAGVVVAAVVAEPIEPAEQQKQLLQRPTLLQLEG